MVHFCLLCHPFVHRIYLSLFSPDKAGGNWSYEQEEELKTLFDQYKEAEGNTGS